MQHLPVELTKSFLIKSVPDVDVSVGASRGECVVLTVEGYGIDGVDRLDAILLDPVTFEGILFLLDLGARVKVLHCYSTLQRKTNWTIYIYPITGMYTGINSVHHGCAMKRWKSHPISLFKP